MPRERVGFICEVRGSVSGARHWHVWRAPCARRVCVCVGSRVCQGGFVGCVWPHACMHACMRTRVCTCTWVCVCMCSRARTRAHNLCVCVYVAGRGGESPRSGGEGGPARVGEAVGWGLMLGKAAAKMSKTLTNLCLPRGCTCVHTRSNLRPEQNRTASRADRSRSRYEHKQISGPRRLPVRAYSQARDQPSFQPQGELLG